MSAQGIAYGVKILSSRRHPLQLPDSGISDQSITLEIMPHCSADRGIFTFHTPTFNVHARTLFLSSNLPFNAERKAIQRRWKITIKGVCTFDWQNKNNIIRIAANSEPDMHVVTFWLLHTVLPVYLMLKESSFFLHASAVAIDNQALLFLAPSFGGKSTLADYFVRQGHQLLSDDKVRLQYQAGQFRAFPSHPYCRAERINECLGVLTDNFAKAPLPVSLFFRLNRVASYTRLNIKKIAGLKKFECIKQAYLYDPMSLAQQEIQHILSLTGLCRIFDVQFPSNLVRLPELYHAILEHADHAVKQK